MKQGYPSFVRELKDYGDGDINDLIGDSYVVIHPEDWKKEYEENGTTE